MSQDFAIRSACLATDLEPLVRFNLAIAMETEAKQLDAEVLRRGLTTLMENEQLGFYLVAESAGEVIGSLMVTKEWSDWRNGVFWWIQSVYVAAPFRRRGVYRALYEQVQQRAANHNVCGFRLYVERNNVVAQKTYESMGMHETPYKMYEQGWSTE